MIKLGSTTLPTRKLQATSRLTKIMLFLHGSSLEADPGTAHDEKQWSGRRAK